jgi:hypothetical protein
MIDITIAEIGEGQPPMVRNDWLPSGFESNCSKCPLLRFAMYDILHTLLVNPTGSSACPTVTATPNAVKASFTKESVLFSENGMIDLDPILNLPDRTICAVQTYKAYLRASILVACAACVAAQSAPNSPGISESPSEIVQRIVQHNALRSEHLKYFTSLRHYHIEVQGLGRSTSADMHATVTYTVGAGKTFQVVDESGSHLLVNHVLLRLLETERDDSREQQQSALTPSNYNFDFQTETTENGRPVYVFAVEPRTKNKLLYRGKIWIDAADYAVVRVDAQPAENPSFWIKSTQIHHVYAKNGEFWLPQTNRSESKVRFGGTAVLTIDYGTYQFDAPRTDFNGAFRTRIQ